MTARSRWDATRVPLDDPRHGRRWLYVHGCRCDACTAANARYQIESNADRKARGVPDHVPHGTISAYTNYGCRCATCVKTNSDQCKAYRALRKAEAS